MKTTVSLYATMALLVLSLPARAKVVYANGALPAGGDGTTWPTACRYLQDALALTATGDEVWVAAGTYLPDAGAAVTTGDRTATFTLKKDVKLYGGFKSGETTLNQRDFLQNITVLSGGISTQETYRSLHVVKVEGPATLDGVSVTMGNANGNTEPFNDGGAVLAASAGSTLTLTNCIFTANAATNGGAVYAYGSSVTASNCTFSGNSAASGAGIYSLVLPSSDPVSVSNCTFTGNTASSIGGAVCTYSKLANVNSYVTATDCVFTENNAAAGGGALGSTSMYYSSNTTLTAIKCSFSNNASSHSYGGGIYSLSGSSTVTISDCQFASHSAGQGAAVYSRGGYFSTVTSTRCTFSANNGGAIYSYATPSVTFNNSVITTGCTFSNNADSWYGGAITTNDSPSSSVTSSNCTYTNNSAKSGGAIYAHALTASNCTFSGNSASGPGGAIRANVKVTDCGFDKNTASFDNLSHGGAISSGATVNIAGCDFTNNSSSGNGGAINAGSSVISTNCAFSNNGSKHNGAAIQSESTTATNCVFSENSTDSFGGAIHSNDVTANSCTLNNNLAKGTGRKGGAIYASGVVTLYNNIIWHSLAEAQSNLIYITSTGSLTNIDGPFPSPANEARNLITGGDSSITAEPGAVVTMGDTSVTLLTSDPLFADPGNPMGADGIWRTPDDGLRLQATSPAVDQGRSAILPLDANDLDKDGDLKESTPVDVSGFNRVQGSESDLGAYEAGELFQPVTIVTQPADSTQPRDIAATISVVASGYHLHYQWYQGNSGITSRPIPGATGSSYTTTELFTTSRYWVRVSNYFENVDSQTTTVTVTGPITTLSKLMLSSGRLSPSFYNATTEYIVKLPNAIAGLQVTPTTTDPASQVKVNGTIVASGTNSNLIPLNVGSNTVNILVTAQDGVTTTEYTVTVMRAPSSVSTLSDLRINTGTYSPVFSSGVRSYTTKVSNTVTSVRVRPRATQSAATVKVNGVAVTSGAQSQEIPL